MYKNFFGLRENPFNVNPNPRFLYLTPQTQEALDELTYGIENRKGFILLTGEVGTGKTTLINRILDWLRQRKMPVAFIFNSHMSVDHLFEFILTDFGISVDSRLKSNMLMRLNAWLIERFRAGDNPVLIVDEAQGLSFKLLEEIRLLLNLETASEKLLQVVLAGQPELEDKLKRPELRQLRQRITLRCRTAPFTLEESRGYIAERLRIGGATGDPIFASDAMDVVHFYSQGIPRIINLLCEHALVGAYAEHCRLVPARMVEEAAHEFFLDEGRRFGTHGNSAVVVSSNPVVTDSISVNVLARPLEAEPENLLEPSHATSPAELRTCLAIEEPALTARNNIVTTVRQGETISASMGNSNASVFLRDLIPASVGPEVKPTILAIPPLLLTRPRAEEESSSSAKGSPIPLAESGAPPLRTVNQVPRTTRRTAIPDWMNGFLPTISLVEWSHVPFVALRRIRQLTFLVRESLRRWKVEFRFDWIAMMNAVALPEMKKSLLRWLR
jgi:type II secretory pathway predicted ATPase ExeA